MKNMRISKKLILSFLIVVLMAVLIGAIGIFGMNSLNSSSSAMYDENLQAIKAMKTISEIFADQRSDMRSLFLATLYDGSSTDVPSTITKIKENSKLAEDAFPLYEATITDMSAETEYFGFKDTWFNTYTPLKNETFDLIERGEFSEAYRNYMEVGGSILGPMLSALTVSSDNNVYWADKADSDMDALFFTLMVVSVVIMVVAVAFSMFLALYISKMISSPLVPLTAFLQKAGSTGDITLSPVDVKTIENFSQYNDETGQCIRGAASFIKRVTDISAILDNIANGDLTVDIDLLSDKDVMGSSVKAMLKSMNEMFGEINSSSTQVDSGAKQIADGAQALSQGSTEQAASIEQLSSSITEISGQTKANADMAEKAAQLTDVIRSNAEKGERQMDEMMAAVRDINTASQNISKVIKVIDDIAFQTNILALNAAVEAARAGQHGKGFAVVAEEVRNLAAKSAEAAKETGDMIQNSMEKAELGSRIASDTAQSFAEISSGIQESSQLIGEIANSSKEQAMGISQVNIGIDQVAQVVQQNSATAEESAAASEEMSGQSAMLQELISQFKLRG